MKSLPGFVSISAERRAAGELSPDLATYAKAVGGGVPLSVLAGRSEFMEHIASGEVVHAGTLNGNPLCLAAARATIELLAADNGSIYQRHAGPGGPAAGRHCRRSNETGLPVAISGDGPVFQVSFMEKPARNYRETLRAQEFACIATLPWVCWTRACWCFPTDAGMSRRPTPMRISIARSKPFSSVCTGSGA